MNWNARLARTLCAFLTLVSGGPCIAQVYRCVDAKGATAYQSTPCESSARSGAQVQLNVSAADADAVARRAKAKELQAAQAASAAATSAALAPATAQPSPPPKPELEQLADICIDWYRPLLKDPRGAYFRDAAYKDYVLTLNIYATNSYGGYVSKSAACEIKHGKLDEAWTKTHAKRHYWGEK